MVLVALWWCFSVTMTSRRTRERTISLTAAQMPLKKKKFFLHNIVKFGEDPFFQVIPMMPWRLRLPVFPLTNVFSWFWELLGIFLGFSYTFCLGLSLLFFFGFPGFANFGWFVIVGLTDAPFVEYFFPRVLEGKSQFFLNPFDTQPNVCFSRFYQI